MNTPSALTLQWHARETERFASGAYKPIPVNLDYPASHFAHLSTTETEADYVAYTPSDQYGQADRQVRLKFGRYLKKTFESLSDAEIQAYVTNLKSALAIADKPATLHFATDVETINQIFETRMFACGSSCDSCMYGRFDGDDIRPYHVYANSPDVAVAYVTVADAIVSRSVVSTKDKVWVRCYAIASGDNDTECGTLRSLLADAGYEEGDLYGNRLSKLDTYEVMLPYIDNGGADVKADGKWWRVVESGGDYTADCTDGTATDNRDRCSCCDETENNCECITCECCEERSRHGCNECSMCEQCDGCTSHNGCDCERCSECSEIISPTSRYIPSCDCSRCGDCSELTDGCTCEPDEDEDEETDDEETKSASVVTPVIDCEPIPTITCRDARHKLNRIYLSLLKTRGGPCSCPAEYQLLVHLVSLIPNTTDVPAVEVSVAVEACA